MALALDCNGAGTAAAGNGGMMRKRSSNTNEKKDHPRKRGKIVTVAKQRALNIVKSHVKMSKIIEGLYLCSVKAVTEENIQQNDIRASVDLSKMRVIERKIKNNSDIHKLVLDINDEPRQAAVLQRQLPRVYAFIEENVKSGRNVCVNCQAGISRSATVVIGYLMHTRGISFDAAYSMVRKRRPIINPNKGFVNMLKYTMKPSKACSSRHGPS